MQICVESELPNEQLAYLLLQEDVIVELTVNNSIRFEGSLVYFHKFSEGELPKRNYLSQECSSF